MNAKILGLATWLCAIVSTAQSAPVLNVIPGGVQAGNWVWNVSITPDLNLVPDNSGTPLAVELGFALSGGSLLNITNVNPSGFDTSNPGAKIFGWEITYPDNNNRPVGIEANCIGCTVVNPINPFNHPTTIVPGLTNQMFVAMGSANFTTSGSKPFLQIVATGPAAGSPSSTLQWLGAYGAGSSNGRITQITGLFGTTYTTSNFDTFSGSATQSIPEPGTAALVGFGALVSSLILRGRGKTRVCN
jgi:hypothetical protein